jgi:hypothetical protein
VLERGTDAAHVRVGLAVGQAREAVEAVAAEAAARFRVGIVQVDADGRWNGWCPLRSKSSDSCWIAERSRSPGFGRVLACFAVDDVEALRLGVVRLLVGVGDRPGERVAAVVLDLLEVALATRITYELQSSRNGR